MRTNAPPAPPPIGSDDNHQSAPPARFSLSATQLVASALAATTATVAASYLGVAGTVIGAAVASVLTVVGNAVYSHSIRRTGERVREAVPIAARWAPRLGAEPVPVRRAEPPRRRGRWQVMAAACVGVFAGVLLVVTGVELLAGRPLSDVVHGTTGSGTSVFGDQTQPTKSAPAPTPTRTVTVTPSVVVVTPTITVTTSPSTKTVTNSDSPSTSTSGTSTPSPSPTPSTPSTDVGTPSTSTTR